MVDYPFTTPENDTHHLFAAIGEGLCMWTNLEDSLCGLYGSTLDIPRGSGLAAKAFWPVVSIEARLKLVNSVFQHRYSSDEWALLQWKIILTSINNLKPLRNELAHCDVVPTHVEGIYRGTWLIPYYSRFKDIDHVPTLEEIEAIFEGGDVFYRHAKKRTLGDVKSWIEKVQKESMRLHQLTLILSGAITRAEYASS